MFFYIYADYFQLWQPGHLQGMLERRRPFAGSLPKMSSDANAFEISDIQEDETEAPKSG
jgi:hypothetical protein